MTTSDITKDLIYDSVAPDDFEAMLELDRYGSRSSAFDRIISATHEHYWDPLNPKYIDFSTPFDMENQMLVPEGMIASTHTHYVSSTLTDWKTRVRFVNESVLRAFSTILHGEIELAKLELKTSVKNGGVGVGLFAAAGVLLVFSLTFGLLALAEGLIALGLYRWLGYLVVFALLLLIIALFVFIGIKKVKRVRAPKQTIDTTKDTVAYLKSHPKTTP